MKSSPRSKKSFSVPNALKSKKILITAGPTREYWDPVRFMTNPSSGKLGVAIAEAFCSRGADVTLVAGPVDIPVSNNIRVRRVTTALQMHRAAKAVWPSADAFVATAAVSDWRFASPSAKKMKRGGKNSMRVRLIANPDIIAEAGRWRKIKNRRRPILVGFALETERLMPSAARKMRAKNLDLIIANKPETFGAGKIAGTWLERGCPPESFVRMSKRDLARRVAGWVERKLI